MRLLTMGPRLIQEYRTVKEYAETANLRDTDLIITVAAIYDTLLRPYTGDANVLLCDKYGNEEPTDLMLEAIIADASQLTFDRIIAIGGGAVMDMAKVVSVSRGRPLDHIIEDPSSCERHVGLVLVPTTCGTGSEVTEIAALNRTRLSTKAGIDSPAMFADEAVLIPELLYGLPDHVFATSSIDALVHAVESTLSPNATPYTKLFGYRAISIIVKGYQAIAAAGDFGTQARRSARNELMRDFLIASNYAGLSFETGGCAAVHALSYQLGGKYHVPHGEANYAMFTGVLKCYMSIRSDGEIAAMNAFLSELLDCETDVVYDRLERLIDQILPKKRLREYGVTRDDLPQFADNVINTQQRLMRNCFVPLDRDHVLSIFETLY